MDPLQLSAIGSGSALAGVTVLLSFWENIVKTKNVHMKTSILIAILSYIVSMSFVSSSWSYLGLGNPDGFATRIICATAFYDFFFACLTYHSAYRTFLICKPFHPRVWLLAAGVTLTQIVIHGTASYFWATNMKANYGTIPSPISTTMETVVLVYYSTVESVLFLITQYKIVESTTATKTNVSMVTKLTTYMNGFARSIAYTANICIGFIALGEVIPVTHNWNFPMYGPAFLIIIILTDVGRFQDCMTKLHNLDSTSGRKGHGHSSNGGPAGRTVQLSDAKSGGDYHDGNRHC
ncbi:uncharacterized protein SPPG_06931 [Spizellomyces punctatus DAOM BR117]|uniref:Uncharacterized protein n=1 Tax=Spizellomyces punctatus (strain DAOM BR117) TaxID=645134 RepID=A0A0L0HB47_SPIPD|nr:uncharacterized protein SPPG_06931 [Spizellomyces punctatus DAOM BR117]KNC97943.1 hypothetical protein SPPG_06931 [Spizellomyces punctatus DAOM BR117]|eukprot:XP_016605983.1 hypothetical protein SPPG_06931 [Spizellomyces punctatus DAOM BR117]